MEEKISKILSSLEYHELQKMKRDLDSGGILFSHILEKKISEVEQKDRKVCASCGNTMSTEKQEIYTLLFGSLSIRKKASFCGIDCLHDFLGEIKDQKEQLFKREEEFQRREDM